MTNYSLMTVLAVALCWVNGQVIDKNVELIGARETFHGFGRPALYMDFGVQGPAPEPTWQAKAMLMAGGGEGGPTGHITFRQQHPASSVLVNINATGVPMGKHALHIHTFGDLMEGCKSTGPHFRSILIGNMDVKEDGKVEMGFYSSYVQLFGPRGIIGRSIVIHEKPIEFNRAPDIYGVPVGNPSAQPVVQTEEEAVGSVLACGIITITDIRQQ